MEQYPVGSIWRDRDTDEEHRVVKVDNTGKQTIVTIESRSGRSMVAAGWLLKQFERV
jgi:hypothetical protein